MFLGNISGVFGWKIVTEFGARTKSFRLITLCSNETDIRVCKK
jgi:hypothetical protein